MGKRVRKKGRDGEGWIDKRRRKEGSSGRRNGRVERRKDGWMDGWKERRQKGRKEGGKT